MVHAIDFAPAMLEQARRKPGAGRVAFAVHDLAQPLPFEAGRFDRVICGLVVDHIADLDGLFRDMARVCKPGDVGKSGGGGAVVVVSHAGRGVRWASRPGAGARGGREARRDTRPAPTLRVGPRGGVGTGGSPAALLAPDGHDGLDDGLVASLGEVGDALDEAAHQGAPASRKSTTSEVIIFIATGTDSSAA